MNAVKNKFQLRWMLTEDENGYEEQELWLQNQNNTSYLKPLGKPLLHKKSSVNQKDIH